MVRFGLQRHRKKKCYCKSEKNEKLNGNLHNGVENTNTRARGPINMPLLEPGHTVPRQTDVLKSMSAFIRHIVTQLVIS